MILMIDNYDSFTYNIVQYIQEIGYDVTVYRNNKITLNEIETLQPKSIFLSPGPGTPNEAGMCMEIITRFSNSIPIFGVCLGHQAIAQAFGGKIIRAKEVMHGKTSKIIHDGKTIFKKIPVPFNAMRYHSLIVDPNTIPSCLEITAWSETGEIMGVRHKEFAVEGVQFHPESILSEFGKNLLNNFIEKYSLSIVK